MALPRRTTDFDADKLAIRAKGVISGQAAAGTQTVFEYMFTEDRIITGGQLMLEGQVYGDKVHLEFVDVDNMLGYGYNVVLDRFVDGWYTDWLSCQQPRPKVEYPALVLMGLYLRIIYVSVGENPVKVAFNLEGHKIKSV